MSGRFVRASKYRHVHGTIDKERHTGLRPNCQGDGDYVAANGKFVAFAKVGGGGPVDCLRIDKPGRLAVGHPFINVHKAKVLDLAFNPFFENLLATTSDDLHIKVSKIPEEGLTETLTDAVADLQGHQKKATVISWHPTATNVLASVAHDTTVKVWDVESQSEALSLDLKEQPQSLAWSYDGGHIAVTTKDKKVRLFDPRAPEAVQEANAFAGGKPARVTFLGDTGRLAAVGFGARSNRRLKLWDARKLGEEMTAHDIDTGSGVIIPYFDNDNKVLYLAGKGDGNIRYFEVVDEKPYFHFLSEFRDRSPQKGACFIPKLSLDVQHCEIARAMRLMRDEIQMVSFQVPRKSDLFQEDIYPDTAGNTPSLKAEEYFAGKNAEPIKVSMDPTKRTDGPKLVFEAQKSPAELRAELDAANKRIKELEAEVAKLKAS